MSDDLVKSRLGYTYDLKDALRHNPTIIQAGDDICAVALGRIEALEAENARITSELRWYANRENWQRHAGASKMLCRAVQDSGKRARAVLQEKDKERTNDQEPM